MTDISQPYQKSTLLSFAYMLLLYGGVFLMFVIMGGPSIGVGVFGIVLVILAAGSWAILIKRGRAEASVAALIQRYQQSYSTESDPDSTDPPSSSSQK